MTRRYGLRDDQDRYEQTTQALSEYLRKTNLDELNPEGLEQDLSTLLSDPKAGVSALWSRLSQVDRELNSWVSAEIWLNDNVRNYLNGLERPELNYEAIKQDFSTLFDDPKVGLEALRDRLTQFDRETLVAVLSSLKLPLPKGKGISEESINKLS